MRKRVKKQLRKQEKGRYEDALDKIHQLEVEVSHLQRALHISEEHGKKLDAMFKQLQAEYEELETSSEAIISRRVAALEDTKAYVDELNAVIRSLDDTIDELKQPWWRRWWRIWKETKMEMKKGSAIS